LLKQAREITVKVLFINDYATPTGGAEITIFILKEELEKRGHEVRIFASSAAIIPIEAHNPVNLCFGTLSRLRTYLQIANVSAYFQLKKILSSWQPDLVHISIFLTQLSPLILPLLQDYPVLWHLHWYRGICPIGTKLLQNGKNCKSDYGKPCLKGGCLPVYQWLPLMWQMQYLEKYKFVFRRIVAVSNFVKTAFETAGYNNIDVIYNAISSHHRNNYDAFNVKPIVVFAGRLVTEKGVDLLLQSFKKVSQTIPDAILKIAGDGIERENLEKLSRTLDLQAQVQFLGHISAAELEIQFADAWVQVVPSIWNEPFGLTVLEGMQRGTPIVATKLGGITEFVSHQHTGLLVDANEDELVSSILLLLQDEELRQKIRQNAFDFVQKYNRADEFADKFIEIYMEMS
jgi:glycosyltransferase involved in cell wall biosynthesis